MNPSKVVLGFEEKGSNDGATYHLPTAEYNYENDATRRSVLDDGAKRAAATTGRSYAVLVTESKGRTWSGLDKVK